MTFSKLYRCFEIENAWSVKLCFSTVATMLYPVVYQISSHFDILIIDAGLLNVRAATGKRGISIAPSNSRTKSNAIRVGLFVPPSQGTSKLQMGQ